MADEQKQRITDFNHHPNTRLLQKLLDIRESGMRIQVPERYQHFLGRPTPRSPHYALTRKLIRMHLLPPSPNLTDEMRRMMDHISSDKLEYRGEIYTHIQADTSFWPVALNPNRGASGLYTWEHIFYRDCLNDYLLGLQSLFLHCDLFMKDFESAVDYIPSLQFFTVPVRFWLGGSPPDADGNPSKDPTSEIYGSETILIDYIKTSFSTLFEDLFHSVEDPYEIVKSINPHVIEDTFYSYVKINDEEERKMIHDPSHPLDESYDEDEEEGTFSIYWWFPDSISDHLDQIVRDSKVTDEE